MLLNLRDIEVSFGSKPLLDKASLTVHTKEVISILGRNGEGKSTLLKLIAGLISADDGSYEQASNTTIAYLPQEVPTHDAGDVFTVVAAGLADTAQLLTDYHRASLALGNDACEKNIQHLTDAQQAMEHADGWQFKQRVDTIISRIGLTADAAFAQLSGGMKRRALLGKALVQNPDVLLLDEPTNHLDITSIEWLEGLIQSFAGSVLLVTHDRAFMQAVTTRIIELDRGQISSWPGDYQNYLRRKDERAHAEALAQAKFDKKLSQEEQWIRQGIKARRTRNEGRVRALKAMREAYKNRRKQQGNAKLSAQDVGYAGKLVIEAQGLSHHWGKPSHIHDFSLTISRGDKIGIIGPNGCGKTTLLNLLLGKLKPQQGSVKIGSNVQIAYFDQLAESLDLHKTLQENIGDGSEHIFINGKSRHITAYLQDFLFTPQQGRQPMHALSGGERNRALLAKLFTQPANLLVLDEPTNDLDIETLDLLEELLVNYEGSVILVSHDRAFLDQVVTSAIIFETDGKLYESIGGYSDWQAIRHTVVSTDTPEVKSPVRTEKKPPTKPRKRSYKEQRELDALPQRIEAAETSITQLQQQLADPDFYKDHQKVSKATAALTEQEQHLQELYARWEALEAKQ